MLALVSIALASAVQSGDSWLLSPSVSKVLLYFCGFFDDYRSGNNVFRSSLYFSKCYHMERSSAPERAPQEIPPSFVALDIDDFNTIAMPFNPFLIVFR